MTPFEYLLFYETNEKFYFDPCTSDRLPVENNPNCLIIDRYSGDLHISVRSNLPYASSDRLIYGIFGIISLPKCKHLVIITRRTLVATLNGDCVYAIESMEILPYIPTSQLSRSVEEVAENQAYYLLLQTFLDFQYFYFSPTYDLTHTLQNLQSTDADFRRSSLFERAEKRFVWNAHMTREFTRLNKQQADQYVMPIMLGFVGSLSDCQINGRRFQLTLIARRSVFRAGVRFYSRGVDIEGHVSNFVEIEQILEMEPYMASLVQTRGSIPLFWSQKPNLERLPSPKIRMDQDHATAFKRHMQSLLQLYYERMCALSLISQSGREKQLAAAFEHLCMNAGEKIRFVAFDFHKECKKLDWSKLNDLMDNLNPIIATYGHFSCNKAHAVEPELSRQSGTFRTNCIDCLDRTNVVQSLIAHKSLEFQLKQFGVLPVDGSLRFYNDFNALFNAVWADNGDALSIHYAGTGALKTDFTRTGTRTVMGLINDGINTGKRYYINNFVDGFRQDALDFALGNFSLSDRSIIKLSEWEWRHYIGILLIFVSSMFLLALILSTDSTFCFGWGLISMLVLAYAYYAGEQIVCRPKLKSD